MRTASIALISILCAGLASPALADNDKNKGHGSSSKTGQSDDDRGRRNDGPTLERRTVPGFPAVVPHQQIVIDDHDRDKVHTYYRAEYAAGRCPPGLAKKNNGCMPPGLANRAWVIGQPLPAEIVYHPMPRELWSQLTPPPYGYEYARVNNDIVLISPATRVIAGLLGNLGNFVY